MPSLTVCMAVARFKIVYLCANGSASTSVLAFFYLMYPILTVLRIQLLLTACALLENGLISFGLF